METGTPKIRLAVPTRGNIRGELVSWLLEVPHQTEDYELCDYDIIMDFPISGSRNRLVKRFLETDADFLLMMDDDVCPTGNVMKLVKHDFDVIGLSCPFYDESKRRFALAVGGQEDVNNADAMHCEWVGTACVMIARRVLEHRAMAAPFQFRFDGDGIRTTSEDVSFCLRAREAGFTVWASKRYSCEHYKTMPLTHCWQDQQDAAMYRQFVKRHDLY